MGRAKRDSTLESRTNRLKLAYREAPRWSALAEGEHIGYYKPVSNAAGVWKAKWRDKNTGERKKVTIGTADDYDDADGIRILDFKQAQDKAHKWFGDVSREARRKADGGTVHEGPYTVANAMDDYSRDCERRGLKGLREQNYQVEAHIRPNLGDIEVGKLTVRRIEKWMDDLATSPRRRVSPRRGASPDRHVPTPRKFKVPRPPKPELEPSKPPNTPEEKRARKDTANRVFSILNAALNLALKKKEYRGEAVWQEVDPYENTKSARMRFLALADQRRIVRACPPDFQQLVKAALYTGGRYGELTRLTVADYNREAMSIYVPGHLTKNGKARHIILKAEGARFFEAITAGRKTDEPLFLRDGEVNRTAREGGNQWLAGDQRDFMEAAWENAKIARLTFHELRHTAASTWIAAGMDLILVANQLGHADTRMVQEHYGHLCPDGAAARFRSIAPDLGLEEPEKVAALQIKTS